MNGMNRLRIMSRADCVSNVVLTECWLVRSLSVQGFVTVAQGTWAEIYQHSGTV